MGSALREAELREAPYLPHDFDPSWPVPPELVLPPLSPRQSIVVRAVADWMTPAEIAERLSISQQTVLNRLSAAARTLGLPPWRGAHGELRRALARWVVTAPSRTLPPREAPRRWIGQWNGMFVPVALPIVVARTEFPPADEWQRLSPKLQAVLWELARGATNPEIAARLGISEFAVKHRLYAARAAIGLHGKESRTWLALWVWSLFGDPDAARGQTPLPFPGSPREAR